MAEERQGLPFHRLHLLGRTGTGWALLGTVLLMLLAFVAAPIAALAPIQIITRIFGGSIGVDPLTPGGLAWINLHWALAIPFAILVPRWIHRLPLAWLTSVAGTIRWRWFAWCLAIAAVAMVLTVILGSFLPETGGAEVSGEVNAFTRQTAAFLLVIVLLTPLQAAGEEYVFRGYLTQAFGGLFSGRLGLAVAIVVPAVLFAVAHGPQDAPIFTHRLLFGMLAGVLVVLTGGLEAAIAMHVLNNWAAFGLELAFGDIGAAVQPSADNWWPVVTALVQTALFLVLTVWVARHRGVASRTSGAVLERPERDV